MRYSNPIPDLDEHAIVRFWREFDPSRPNNECWTNGKTVDNYTTFSYQKVTYYRHKVAYHLHYGPVPTHYTINHKCNNRACFNPRHLYAGSDKENAYDRELAKGNPDFMPLERHKYLESLK